MPNFAGTCDENPLKYTRTVLYNVEKSVYFQQAERL